MPGGRVLTVRLRPRRGWVVVPVQVGGAIVEMVLDTGAPLSGISQQTADLLLPSNFLEPMQNRPGVYLLRQLTGEEWFHCRFFGRRRFPTFELNLNDSFLI